MASSRTSHFLLAFLALVPSSFASFECKDILAKNQHFDFKKLGGPHVVHHTHQDLEALAEYRYNFTVDICSVLKRDKGVKTENWCHDGSRVCGTRETIDLTGAQNNSIRAIDIAGTYTMKAGPHMVLDEKFRLLRDSGPNSDASREGVLAEFHGGRYPFEDGKKGVDQQAIIEFVCDHEREGNEGDELDDGEKEEPKEDEGGDKGEDGDKKEERRLRRRDGETGKCEESDASLRFCGYDVETSDKDKKVQTLRLEWRTKYACDNAPSDGESSHWGFFTWFIIILFLATAAYLIFGSWLNYNRYGARGWDLLPHGDTIRDIPYIIKDIGRKVVSTVQSPGSRGGYSAV
ncbi:type II membrane protein [Kalmusia sp. IMI 367209]|nr:type II membrane protein [Kalmusia sp. IMI 367209]